MRVNTCIMCTHDKGLCKLLLVGILKERERENLGTGQRESRESVKDTLMELISSKLLKNIIKVNVCLGKK